METETEVRRGPGRPPINRTPPRDIDHKSRAAERMRALRGNLPSEYEQTDKFYIPHEAIPDGWSYEWKRYTTFNQEDPTYSTNLVRTGWEPVPTERHPDMMPRGTPGGNPIIRDGMILMERPAEVTNEIHARNDRRAREQIMAKEEQLGAAPAGTLPRDAHPGVAPRIKKSYSPVEIPE